MHSRGFRTSDSQTNVMGQSTEMSPLVSMLFGTFLNSLKLLMKVINIRTSHTTYVHMQYRLTSANFLCAKA